ncbi:hypothetical protein [Mesorhizobium sp. M7A.F.Ca.US.006.01.1.1]|uniref:hypothetical protein n=1 Tax=Mesorhizobium sp. M7A.F.Ca.US.006.01.1.1 TaxID=2496707 RepID=UPI0013E324AB|nr:hypothetical protein [Mesorhizobium sp. M7A.F.Ca.US.006.01.1.1]
MTTIDRVRAKHVCMPFGLRTGIARRQMTERDHGLLSLTRRKLGAHRLLQTGFVVAGLELYNG